jgi:pyruvate,water dikinase
VESLQGKILVTSSTDPGWVTLFPTCSGILVERGSLLSHSAIVSREMGIPCVVGIRDLLRQVETGWLVEMDGEKGTIHIIDKNPTC